MITSVEYIRFRGIRLHVFHLFYSLGFFMGIVAGLFLTIELQLNIGVIALLSLFSVLTFFTLVKLVKQICGNENIVYYHHELAVVGMSMLVLLVLRQPVLPYLDITIISISTFNIFSRCGCFFVGCCHGKPCAVGVRYDHHHVSQGFPFYYENIRLFPVQLVESAGALLITTACILSVTSQASKPGDILVMYSLLYGCGRFVLEYFRGDPDRWYFAGLSEAQWTTLAIFLLTAVLGYFGVLPLYDWHLVLSAFLLLMAVATLADYRFNSSARYMNPNHLHELAHELSLMKQGNFNDKNSEYIGVSVCTTSRGLTISYSCDPDENVCLYAVSGKPGHKVGRRTAARLGRAIALIHSYPSYEISYYGKGIYHIVYQEKSTT